MGAVCTSSDYCAEGAYGGGAAAAAAAWSCVAHCCCCLRCIRPCTELATATLAAVFSMPTVISSCSQEGSVAFSGSGYAEPSRLSPATKRPSRRRVLTRFISGGGADPQQVQQRPPTGTGECLSVGAGENGVHEGVLASCTAAIANQRR